MYWYPGFSYYVKYSKKLNNKMCVINRKYQYEYIFANINKETIQVNKKLIKNTIKFVDFSINYDLKNATTKSHCFLFNSHPRICLLILEKKNRERET